MMSDTDNIEEQILGVEGVDDTPAQVTGTKQASDFSDAINLFQTLFKNQFAKLDLKLDGRTQGIKKKLTDECKEE